MLFEKMLLIPIFFILRNVASALQIPQIPLQSKPTLQHTNVHLDLTDAPHLFSSLHSLLSQLGNTVYSCGHFIVPGLIPAGTVLYHARKDTKLPSTMEWLAFDAEMSYGIMAGFGGETYMLSYAAQRNLRVLYLDGLSASLGTKGWQDSQDVLVYGHVRNMSERFPWGRRGPGRDTKLAGVVRDRDEPEEDPEDPRGPEFDWFGEYALAKGLCKLGKEWGFEGIVRTNAGFELIWCDFADGIRLLSQTNVTDPSVPSQRFQFPFPRGNHSYPRYPPSPPPPPSDRSINQVSLVLDEKLPDRGGHRPEGPSFNVSAFSSLSWFQWRRSSSWHLTVPGEQRIKLALQHAITFYDPVFKSLKRSREGKQRWQFTLENLDEGEGKIVADMIKTSLERWKEEDHRIFDGSGVQMDWKGVSQTVVQRFEGGLKSLEFSLQNQTSNNLTVEGSINEALQSAYHVAMPFISTLGWPTVEEARVNESLWNGRIGWRDEAVESCTTFFTAITHEEGWKGMRTEIFLRDAIEGVLGRICKTVVEIVGEGYPLLKIESGSFSFPRDAHVTESVEEDEDEDEKKLRERRKLFRKKWSAQVKELREWLGWIDYEGCKGGCRDDEICAVPLWPLTSRQFPNEGEDERPSLVAQCVDAKIYLIDKR